jgi:hypothetical protein
MRKASKTEQDEERADDKKPAGKADILATEDDKDVIF